MNANANTNFGATYNTESGEDFGKIISVFTVDATWDGHRFHGYCRPTPEEVAEFLGRWNEFHKAFEAVEVYRGRMDVAYESYAAYFAQCILHWGLSGKYIISDPSVVPEPLKRYQNPS